nr:aldo/keto reductase [Cytophagales bacterium]
MIETSALSNSGLTIPRVVFGSSDLGNLYRVMTASDKFAIIKKCIDISAPFTVFDTAGKYGAGLALEVIGDCLHQLEIPANQILLSNKLGWIRSPLLSDEPTFEPGVWKGIKHDAVQKISYQGILDCFEEGNRLLKHYTPQLVSVHDPDEYLAAATDDVDEERRFQDILEAYRALQHLKEQGLVVGIGVGAKDWTVIPRIVQHVALDWVMIANSLTIYQHPKPILDFLAYLKSKQVLVINAAVFHGGFLVGGDYFNYKYIDPSLPENKQLLRWRQAFFDCCQKFQIKPSHACIQFGLSVPGVTSLAISAANIESISENYASTQTEIPSSFWEELKHQKLISNLSFI